MAKKLSHMASQSGESKRPLQPAGVGSSPASQPALESPGAILQGLQQALALHQDILSLVERESQALRLSEAGAGFELFQSKKDLLPHLDELLNKIRQHRAAWQRLSSAERAQNPEVTTLLQRNQDLIMKIVVLDRENEQLLLRKGLVPPQSLPSANRQRPHYVAELYRRQGS